MMIYFWENIFGAKTLLSFVFRGAKLSTPWGFQACQSQWYKFQSCMMIHFWENIFGAKTLLSFVFRGAKLSTPWGFQACQSQWYRFQSCMMICFRENMFGAKTSLSFVFTGPNSVHPEVFRHANCNGTSFKAVWWSISEKIYLGLKHYFPLYLQGQAQHTLGFSGMTITMVQVSKLYDDPFMRKHILD